MTPIEWLERAVIKPVPGSVIRRPMIQLIDDVENKGEYWDDSNVMHGRFHEGNADDTFRL